MNKEMVIGVVMDYFKPRMVEGAGAYARQHGIRLDARWSVRADWVPTRVDWDGVLANVVDDEVSLTRIEALGLPLVHLNGWLGARARPRVDANHWKCVQMIVEEFKKLGVQRVAALRNTSRAMDRECYRALRSELRRHEIEFLELPMERSLLDHPEDVALVLEKSKGDSGLFMVHAGLAFSVLIKMRELGVRVPEDVPVIVIDKDVQRTAELAPVPLTGVVTDEWQQGYEAAAMLVRIIRGEIVGSAIRRVNPVGLERRDSTGVVRSRDAVVAKALHFIRERWMRNLGVEELARISGVSRRTLETRFRREMGMTVHEAITRRKMDEAKNLLRTGKQSIAEVGEACGFSSVHYFTAAFKKSTGETPGHCRRRGQEELIRRDR